MQKSGVIAYYANKRRDYKNCKSVVNIPVFPNHFLSIQYVLKNFQITRKGVKSKNANSLLRMSFNGPYVADLGLNQEKCEIVVKMDESFEGKSIKIGK